MKMFSSLLLITFFLVGGSAQTEKKSSASAPKTAAVNFALLDLPGVKDEKSTWEVSFELRIINETGEYQARRAGKLKNMSEEEKLGELVYKNSFAKKSLAAAQNRTVDFQIPLGEEIQKRLQNEPQTRINLSQVTITDEIIKKSKEDEANAQVFLLYGNALVYDAKLKKTTIIPMNRVLRFRDYPSLNFSMSIKVDADGYTFDVALPKNAVLTTVPVKP